MPGVRTTHQVKIGDDYYLIRPGSWRKMPAPLFGARFTTGDPDYNNLSAWQHWVQKCWVGGLGAEEWQDEAMFDEAVGVDTSNHEVLLLSRDLGPTQDRGTKNYDFNLDAAPRQFFVWKNSLYVLVLLANSGELWRYVSSTDTWTLAHTFTERVRSFAEFRTWMYFGDRGPQLTKMTGTPGAEVFTTFGKPAGESDLPYSMAVYKDHMYVDFGSNIWRMRLDGTWDGSTAFYTDNAINYISKMEVHLGFLYMASQNGHILRTDGNNTFDMWQMEQGQGIASIRSFDGRLFIAVGDGVEGVNNDPIEDGRTAEAVLYQFSGAAVTELKRFGRVGRQTGFGNLRVVGGRLFFGASDLLGAEDTDASEGGFGIGMYDPREDAYHLFSSHRDDVNYVEGTDNVNWMVDDVFYFDNYMWCSVRGFGVFKTLLSHRDTSRFLATYETYQYGAPPAAKNGGWITSSTFDGGTPGLEKIWNAIRVDCDLPSTATSVYVEYSLDKGVTWEEAGSQTGDGTQTSYALELLLGSAGTDVRGSSFKWRITLKTTNGTRSPAVRGVVVRYIPVPEPNWVFQADLVLSEKQDLLDGTVEAPDNVTKLANLRSAFRSQELLAMTEPDGTQWAAVRIDSMEERIPHIDASSKGELEYEVAIRLMEMVEEYPA